MMSPFSSLTLLLLCTILGVADSRSSKFARAEWASSSSSITKPSTETKRNPLIAKLASLADTRQSENLVTAPIPPGCMQKVMMQDKVVYENKIKCHHTYFKQCFESYITEFKPETFEECNNEYTKSCFIEYIKEQVDVNIDRCFESLERDCGLPGEEVCSTEFETVCETIYKSYDVNEDEADCQIVTEEECDAEGVCDLIPRQVCNVNSQNVTKTRPDTKCSRIPIRVCGPVGCPLVKTETKCHTDTRSVLEDVPREKCDMAPSRICNEITKLVPRLVPKTKCVNIPKETCVRMRVNPRTIKEPVVKLWCGERAETTTRSTTTTTTTTESVNFEDNNSNDVLFDDTDYTTDN